jgi:predicted nucleic acid-binding protein
VTRLVDTSVWVDFLRGSDTPARTALRRLLRENGGDVVTTEPIAMELLAGAASAFDLARLTKLVDGLPALPVEAALDYRAAAAIHWSCRQVGRTVRNLSDCVIAAIAIRTDVELIHKDVDFETIQLVSPLRATSWREPGHN